MLLSEWTIVASGMRSDVLGYIAQPYCKTACVDRFRSSFLLFPQERQGAKDRFALDSLYIFMAQVWYSPCKDPILRYQPRMSRVSC